MIDTPSSFGWAHPSGGGFSYDNPNAISQAAYNAMFAGWQPTAPPPLPAGHPLLPPLQQQGQQARPPAMPPIGIGSPGAQTFGIGAGAGNFSPLMDMLNNPPMLRGGRPYSRGE